MVFVKRVLVVCVIFLMIFPTLAQEESPFPVVETCFSVSSDLMVRDGLVFQTVDETRPTLGDHVSDVWYIDDGQVHYLLRHTDPRAGFITDGERLLITLWVSSLSRSYLLDSLTASPRPLFRPLAEWFAPQWLSDGRILFNVVTMPDEPVQVVTLNVDPLPETITDDLSSWIHALYEFEQAESIFASGNMRLGAVISPDEQFAVLWRYNEHTYLMDVQMVRLSDRDVLWQDGAGDNGMGVLWHPESTSFVYLQAYNPLTRGYENELVQVDLLGESRLISAFNLDDDELSYHAQLLDWSNDGRYLAFNLYDDVNGSAVLYTVDFAEQTIINTCLEMITEQFFWSFDGTQFVYRADEGWQVGDLTTQQVQNINTLSIFADFSDIYPLVWMKAD
jgi:hypothetical protein